MGKQAVKVTSILYEQDICPVFSINGTPETTYYPCECVIAVGEVKSALGQGSLQDAFKKIASVRRSPNPVLHNGTTGVSI